jgi:hypothetical protein
VTYNDGAVANKIVAFQINGPANAIQNITFSGSSTSNQSGIAYFSFRIPWPSENAKEIVFGEWRVTANVDIADVVVNDSLDFRVGWIIEITSVLTLNDELAPQIDFPRESTIVFDLAVENIALTPKTATIRVAAQDVAGHPIIHIELYNLIVQPGESHVQTSSEIPVNAEIGEAKVSATAYTAPPTMGGTPYSPSAYTTFNIITVKVHDVAITGVSVSSSQAYVGESVEITVETANPGDFAETFNVTVSYDSNLIQVIPAISLSPHSSETIRVEWNTASVNSGVYTISANATIVDGDINPENNRFVDGKITIIPVTVPPYFVPYWVVLIPFLIGLVVAIILLLLILSRRRKRKTAGPSGYVIVVHPHI